MTDLRQAAQQALDALAGELLKMLDKPEDEQYRVKYAYLLTVITALREALAQQAEPICPDCKAALLYECVACSSNNYPTQQQAEPVAYYHPRNGFYWAKPTSIFAPTVVDVPPIPLYTTAAQREWVGLTKQDMPSGEDPMFDHLYFIAGMVYADKVLKKKNT